MLKVLVGVLSFAVIVFFASQSFASANSDADWAIHTTESVETINVSQIHGFPIEFWAGDCIVRFHTAGTADTLTLRVSNAIPAYDLLTYPATITSCATRD